jgi:flagellar hook assembly protein FlgD
MIFSVMASAEVDFHAEPQDDSVKFVIKNIGHEPVYVLDSLAVLDENGTEVYTSQDRSSADLLRIDPGISYALEWNTANVPEGNYTPKIYHGDNKRNLKAISIDFFRGKRNSKPILYTDEKFYKYGEKVDITFMNMGTNKIYVNINNWEIKNLDTGKVVSRVSQDCSFGYGYGYGYGSECPDYFEPLRFLKTVQNIWNQTDIKGNQVVPGKYDVTAEYSKNDPSSKKMRLETISTQKFYIRPTPPVRGDLNGNGISADAGDLDMMKKASIGEITPDSRFDLNNNGIPADAGDLVIMKRASKGEIDLQKTTPGKG